LIGDPQHGKFLLDPETKEVFYNEGHHIGELQPEYDRNKKRKLK